MYNVAKAKHNAWIIYGLIVFFHLYLPAAYNTACIVLYKHMHILHMYYTHVA